MTLEIKREEVLRFAGAIFFVASIVVQAKNKKYLLKYISSIREFRVLFLSFKCSINLHKFIRFVTVLLQNLTMLLCELLALGSTQPPIK